MADWEVLSSLIAADCVTLTESDTSCISSISLLLLFPLSSVFFSRNNVFLTMRVHLEFMWQEIYRINLKSNQICHTTSCYTLRFFYSLTKSVVVWVSLMLHPVLHVEVQSDDSITSNAVQTNQASWSAAVMCGSLSFLYWMFRALGHLNLSSFLVCIYTENVSWIKFQAFAGKLDKPICLKWGRWQEEEVRM